MRLLFCLIGIVASSCLLSNYEGSCEEIITLKKDTEIICATNNNNLTMFLHPPTTEASQNTSLALDIPESEWKWNNLTNIFALPVIDRRWEHFATVFTNYTMFKLLKPLKSFSVSLYSPERVDFFLRDNRHSNRISDQFGKRNTWVHYTIYEENSSTIILKNGDIIHRIQDFSPTHVAVKSKEKTYRKIHDHEVLVADQISRNSTIIQLPKISCLMLYANLCPHCRLEVTNSGELQSLLGEKESAVGSLNAWNHLEISSKSGINITLSRQTDEPHMEGIWIIDLRECPTVFKRKLPSKEVAANKTCQTLNENDSSVGSLKKSSQSLCNAGELGQNCSLKCEDILGSDRKFCEEYQICENTRSDCYCAWGSQGPLCKETCQNGTWGPSCKKICPCSDNCDKITGECLEQSSKSSKITKPSVLLVLTLFFKFLNNGL